ncbi:M14 family zinc carboxypeptidase [Baekduia sp. Peel2402]|uniref:M14 family zinc carboxypeptidase n=1 Tax=Baekduia sp. Peel2402 TaxID=3458296 RepID=UPI00403EBF54
MFPRRARALITTAAALAAAAVLPAGASAAIVDPAGVDATTCTSTLNYDKNVPTWDQWFSDGHDPDAIVPFASKGTLQVGRNLTKTLDDYFDGVTAAVNASAATKDRVAIRKITLGTSELGSVTLGGPNSTVPGRDLAFWVIGTKQHIDNLDSDAAFWAGVRSGSVSETEGLAGVRDRPAFGWATATPHGNEPAAGEAIARELYELAARLDCENLSRLQNMDVFLMPVRNPDGRDNNVRTTSWAFDPNRDFGTHNQQENDIFIPEMNKYPGVFFIDAHQQSNGYFFPPNEDPVHHEISQFSLDFIQNQIGPTLQKTFNDQSSQYQNYNNYDLFTPEYGDTVPSLLMGAAGMTYEKGTSEAYSKQVYDHYLAIDTTINLTAQNKVSILQGWVKQWQEAVDQGSACEMQGNKLVSPLHDTLKQQVPTPAQGGAVCGYFYKPGAHSGDVASLLTNLMAVGVKVYKFTQDTTIPGGVREFGKQATTQTLPAGTLYIPLAQPMKHWIQAVLEEDPYIPYDYYYDVVDWSYSTQRGLAGDGWLTVQPPATTTASMVPVTTVDLGSAPTTTSPVYAFDGDSMQSLAMATELLNAGVTVYRGTAPFSSAGHDFVSGAILVDGASLAASNVNLSTLAHDRNTVVYGLPNIPVAHQALAPPKIGLFTGSATIPSNPINRTGANVTTPTVTAGVANSGVNAGVGQCTSTVFCAAYFTLTQKDKIPASMIVPVTTADLAAHALTTGGFTAFINPTTTIATTDTASLTEISAFVNAGGTYVGDLAGGITTARNAGLTTVNTISTTGLGVLTPGTTFDGTYDTTNPVAWGFDTGGWLYRDATGNPIIDPATLGSAAPVARFGGDGTHPVRAYGYSVNATSLLAGRPAIVDQPFGAGHAVLFAFDPFYRAWKEQDERLVLNAVLYPTGAVLSATRAAPALSEAAVAKATEPVAQPLAKSEVPKVASRPLPKSENVDKDVRIAIKAKDRKALSKAVKAAKLPKSAKGKVKYLVTKSTVTFVVKGVRPLTSEHHPLWIGRVMHQLSKRHVDPISAQL